MAELFSLGAWRLSLALGARLVLREWRAGELKVLASALVVAVASVVAVAAFTDRMERSMQAGATELLAADLLVTSTDPIDEALARQAEAMGLVTARTVTLRSVAVARDRLQLTFVKAVSERYPLRGQVRTSDVVYGADTPATGIPARGTVWAEARLLALLGIDVGERLELGAQSLRVAKVLTYEPDRGGDLFNIAPRVIMRLDELPATGLVQPASRVRHRLLFAGTPDRVAAFDALLESGSNPTIERQGVADARPEMRAALDRADSFLGLAAMVSVLLAGVAVALAARRYAAKNLDTAALLRCMGLSRVGVLQVFIVALLGLGLAASSLGCAIGYLAQSGLSQLLGLMLVSDLPAAGLRPLGHGLAMGLVCLVGFALPPLAALGKVPPLRVLRRDLGKLSAGGTLSYLIAATLLLGLVLWQARDANIAAYVAGGSLVAMLALGAVAWAVIWTLRRARTRLQASAAWRLGMANLTRRAGTSAVQVVAIGLGLMVLLLLVVVRQDLLDAWVKNLPPETPNFFLVNVQPSQTAELATFLERHSIASAPLYPMIRGRLTAINGNPVRPSDFREPRAQRLAARDFNLSWSQYLPKGNRITAGEFWPSASTAKAEAEISVEQGLSRTLGLSLGDTATFTVAGANVTARITSLRKVHWDSFDVNFFVLFPPGPLHDQPATFINSFYLPELQRPALVDLVRRFPSVTVIDIGALLGKVRTMMDQASVAIEYVFSFTLLAGLVVLFAATQTTLDERRLEAAVVRTLGGTRGRILGALLAEFSLLGFLAGGLAALAATLTGAVLALQVFDLPYAPNPWIGLLGICGGIATVVVTGWLGTRKVVNQPPLSTLRES